MAPQLGLRHGLMPGAFCFPKERYSPLFVFFTRPSSAQYSLPSVVTDEVRQGTWKRNQTAPVYAHRAAAQYRWRILPASSAARRLYLDKWVRAIHEGTAFQVKHAHELLESINKVECRCTSGFASYNWNTNTVGSFLEDLSTTTIAADEVPSSPGLFFSIASPAYFKTKRASAQRLVVPSASTRVPRSESAPERTMSSASASSRTRSVIVIDSIPSCRPLRLAFSKVQKPAETATFKCAENTDPDDSSAQQAALLILQELCHLEDFLLPRTVWTALVRALKWLARMALLEN